MRTILDKLMSWIGIALAVVLLIAGALLTWASSFVADNVAQQLTAQHITMPTEQTGLTALPPADQDALKPFAGQPMENGDQAKAYADHYILVHMNEQSKGKTYSEVSGQFIGQCTKDPAAMKTQRCQDLGTLRQTLFMGSTLRGLLLYGYAFATIGKIAGYAAVAAFVGAAVLLVLGFLGFRHAKQAAGEGRPTPGATSATA